MFSPVPLINRIDRLKESETRISLDDIWDYPVRPQRFSMWSTQPPHLRNTPPLRAAGRGIQRPNCSSPSPSSPAAGTRNKDLDAPAKPHAPTISHTRATLPSAFRFAETHPSNSPPCALIRRSAQHGRPSPITSRTPRGPQKAGPSDARPSSLKWRIPVHTDGVQAGVVPSIVISPPDNAGNLRDVVCHSSTSDSSVNGEKETDMEDTRTQYLRRTTTRILGPAKSEPSPASSRKNDHPNPTPSPPSDTSPTNQMYCAPKAEEEFTLPEDYASTLRLRIVHCPRRKRAWRVMERCLDGFWRRVGW